MDTGSLLLKTPNKNFLNMLLLAAVMLWPEFSTAKTLTGAIIGGVIGYELADAEHSKIKPETALEQLLHACAEYVEMFDRRESGAFQAWLTTTTTEALKAGFCKGSIHQYVRGIGCPPGKEQMSRTTLDLARRILYHPDSIRHPREIHSDSYLLNYRPFNEQDLLAWAICNVE